MNNTSRLADVTICPRCKADGLAYGNRLVRCESCGGEYPMKGGIPDFTLPSIRDVVRATQEAFEFKWKLADNFKYTQESYCLDENGEKTHFPVQLVARDDNWIELTKAQFDLAEEDVRGKTVLDIGAGFGRMAYIMHNLGAEHIFGLDLCRSGMQRALAELDDQDDISFVQADIADMPFKPQSFDVVVSWGVFHHTPDTERAFRLGAKLVKPGGLMLVHLYERQSPIRIACTNAMRRFIQLFPLPTQYALCNRLFVVRDWSVFSRKTPKALAMRLLHKLFMYGQNPIGVFDAYSPRFNHTHTDEEVLAWYREEGFVDAGVVNKTYDAPGLSRFQNAFRRWENGKHGGALLMRGKKARYG